MKVLVTGATGFIGKYLVRRLSSQHEIFILARNTTQAFSEPTSSIITMDLAGPIDSKALPERVDTIIHLAQATVPLPQSANEMFAVNTHSTQQLLDYARKSGVRRFVLASTGDVYGREGRAREIDPASPLSFYGVTKRAAEMFVGSYSDYFETCILRLFHPYGPGQSNRLIPKIADRLRLREPVLLHDSDRPHLTPIYIDDLILAIERVVESSYIGILNIAGERGVSIRELAEEIGSVLGYRPIFKDTGKAVVDLAGDSELMKEVLGEWTMVGLAEGLNRALNVK